MLELLLIVAATMAEAPDLAASLRAGDRTAFRSLFERHHGELLRYLRYRNVPDEQAEDLVQQAFVTVWERRETLRDDGSVRGLLFRIAYSRALNHFRDTARLERSETDEFEGSAPAPDLHAESRFIRERLQAAVAALPERRRAVFELCMLEGLSYREASEALDISVKTVENQMAHALRAVRAALAVHREDSRAGG